MRKLLAAILFGSAISVFAQFNGIVTEGVPYNQTNHFLFSSSSDTIINGTWSQLADYPQALFGVNTFYWPAAGKIFVCGGATVQGSPQKACYFYNPITNSYEGADSLPAGRWSGKLVRVKDSLYLVGSVSNWTNPDGNVYKYSPSQNQWIVKDTMPLPRVHEPAVCVFNDSLIICIGGSTGSFAGTTNIIRVYNPYFSTWKTISSFPINTTSGHAECNSVDSSIIVVGGTSPSFISTIYRGKISFLADSTHDSIKITWNAVALNDSTLFHTGVYRVGGGNAGDWMMFGPALRNSSTYNTVYTVKFTSDTNMYWYRCIPNVPDSAGNRPTIAVRQNNDSVFLYMFAGSVGLTTVQTAYRYSFALPVPIGIKEISGSIPKEYKLYQNYPNPFNPATRIRFELPNIGVRNLRVKLIVYDILGREIAELVNEELRPGTYEFNWDGSAYASGVYFYSLTAGDFRENKKMILIK
jgi:hypothetical protein